MKLDPLIFEHALKSLNVSAQSSLYVDDYDVEADKDVTRHRTIC